MADPDELPALVDGDLPALAELPSSSDLPGLAHTQGEDAAAWRQAAPRVDYGPPREILKVLLDMALSAAEPGELPSDWTLEQLEAAAGFGDVPSSPLLALPYALRVRKRKPVLEQELARLEQRRTNAVAEANGALMALGDRCAARRQELHLGDLEALLARIDEADSTTADRHDVQQMMDEQDAQERQGLEAALAAARLDAEPEQRAMLIATEAMEQQDVRRKRAEAMLKRAVIALRAARNASAVTEAHIAKLEQERQAAQQAYDEEDAKHRQDKTSLDLAKAKLGEKYAAISAIQGSLDKLLQEQAQTRHEYNTSVAQSHTERGDALCELGAQAIRRGLADKQDAAEVLDALSALRDAHRDLSLTRAAAASFDRRAVQQGMIAACLLGTAVLGTLLWLVS